MKDLDPSVQHDESNKWNRGKWIRWLNEKSEKYPLANDPMIQDEKTNSLFNDVWTRMKSSMSSFLFILSGLTGLLGAFFKSQKTTVNLAEQEGKDLNSCVKELHEKLSIMKAMEFYNPADSSFSRDKKTFVDYKIKFDQVERQLALHARNNDTDTDIGYDSDDDSNPTNRL